MSNIDIEEKIEELSPWFHNIHLPNGAQTAPDHFFGDFPKFKWDEIKGHIPEDLQDWNVLDIGCNAGFYSLEMAKRGANVVGIDLDPHYLKQAEWVISLYGLKDKVSLEQKQVYDMARDNRSFDLIIFMGVLYHLRYPLLALDIITEKANNLMVFQTLTMPGEESVAIADNYNVNDRKEMLHPGWPKMAFIENKLNNDPTNWWALNSACIEAMLRSSGMKVLDLPGDEIYICEKDREKPSVAVTWNRSEYLSALGQDWKEMAGLKVANKNNTLN